MRWLNLGIGVAVVTLLALNLRAQLVTQRKLDALASVPAPPAVGPARVDTAKAVVPNGKDDAYIIEALDMLLIDVKGTQICKSMGPFVIRPDGTVGFRQYGNVAVAGLTLRDAQKKIETHLSRFVDRPSATLEVTAFNGERYYIIDQSAEHEQVFVMPFRRNETVFNAVRPRGSEMNVWVARRSPTGGEPWQILPVDLAGIRSGITASNYQLLPGDRVYLAAK